MPRFTAIERRNRPPESEQAPGRERSAGARRQARLRVRQALGLRSFRLDLDEDRAALACIAAGVLTPEETADHEAVERALAQLVADRILPRDT
ncbi:MAG TPA: hypothetical protein VNF99_09960 [Stellaceae bacterium]|nr:hypothetical protein [Stellaceae bacterium]